MINKHCQNHRGVALLLTLTVITILVATGLQLNREMRQAVAASAVSRDRLTLSQMAASGIHGAMALLIADRVENQTDSLQEDWADPEAVSAALADLTFEAGKVSVNIFDERARIQINALVNFPEGREFNPAQRALWERFAERLLSLAEEDSGDSDPITIINSVKDWLDSGDDDAITGLSGAESSYYKDLDPPYECKNGPFDDLSEVALVKGVTPELFYGWGEILGLSNYLTVYGVSKAENNHFTYDGKININTAELPVLAALLPSDVENSAQALFDYRVEKEGDAYRNNLTSPTWYKNVPGFSGIDIDANLITVSSDIFRIVSTAAQNDIKVTLTAIVERRQDEKSGKWYCKILNWQTS